MVATIAFPVSESPRREYTLVRSLARLAPYLAASSVVYGSVILFFLIFNLQELWVTCLGSTPPSSSIAISFTLVGIGILVDRPHRTTLLCGAIGVIVTAIGISRIIIISTTNSLIIEPQPVHVAIENSLVRLAEGLLNLGVTMTTLLLGLALLARWRQRSTLAQFLSISATFWLYRSALNHTYGVPTENGTISLPSMLTSVICILAILGRTAHHGPLRIFLATSDIGVFCRRQAALIFLAYSTAIFSAFKFNEPMNFGVFATKISFITIVLELVLAFGGVRLTGLLRERLIPKRTSKLLRDFSDSWSRGEIKLLFQPQVNINDSKIKGVEVLIRWHHPQRGMVLPGYFIPEIERSSLMSPLTNWIIKEACIKASNWDTPPLNKLKVCVNVSARQITDKNFPQVIKQILEASGFSPYRLVIEITEGTLMKEGSSAFQAINGLRCMGINIALDDFGTGYSSLAYLNELPLDYLKIDRSFVEKLPENRRCADLTRGIVAIAQTLDLQVIAEGIETLQQAEFLRSIQCSEGQGYFYAKPLTEAQLVQWIKSSSD